jgi:hypothetical protein
MNYNKYVGLPYATNGRDESGIDCWGLVRLFYKQEYNLDLPSYTEEYSGAYDDRILQMMEEYKDNWAQTTTPQPGSVIVFNILGEPFHVGVYIGEDKFVHAREGMDSVVESINSPKWNKRIEGYYNYVAQADVKLTGKPHPFKQTQYTEISIAGTTLADVSKNLIDTYKISNHFAEKLVIFLDGVKIPQTEWSSTKVQAGQNIVYKVIPEGSQGTRLLLMLAVTIIANVYAPGVAETLRLGNYVAASATEATFVASTTGQIVGTMAINMAGMALINAAFPIRQPKSENPGGAAPVNAFNGASNQANRFGAIPVVLGKMRSTAALGAVPYIETLTDTTVMNLSLVWGFGPLDITDIRVGAKTLDEVYFTNQATTAQEHPIPVILNGVPQEDVNAFDALYPSDVEQQFPQIELVKNPTDGNPPAIVTLNNYAEDIDVVLTFPEGMRKISTKDASISEATCAVEIRVRKVGENTWSALPSYRLGDYSATTLDQAAFSTVLAGAPTIQDSSGNNTDLYKFYTLAMAAGGGIDVFEGTATDSLTSDASPYLKALYTEQSYASFVGADASAYSSTYPRLPTIPNGYRKLYTLCFHGSLYMPEETVSHLSSGSVLGLDLTSVTRNPQVTSGGSTVTDTEGNLLLGNTWTVNVEAGRFIVQDGLVAGEPETIFSSKQFSNTVTATPPSSLFLWTPILRTDGVWNSSGGNTFDKTATVTFPYTGYYQIDASSDNEGVVYIDGFRQITIPSKGHYSMASVWYYAQANTTHTVRMAVTNTGGPAGAAVVITYTANAGLNVGGTGTTEIVFGSGGLFSMRKDAFNFVYKIKGLPVGKYQIRVIRNNDDLTEKDEDPNNRYYSKCILSAVVGYNKYELDSNGSLILDSSNNPVPIRVVKNPKNCYLARTFLRVQSTNKVNGSLEGVNALVQTIAPDLNRATNKWDLVKPTNNPAALFLYVLMHPANAYRVADNITSAANYVDLNALAEWYKFCQPMNLVSGKYVQDTTKPWLSYNAVLTNVASVMDVLKDICSAGMASPNYIDGKWTVVVDRPRSAVVQHFTPHNSWGFESTKILPRIPDAFRITLADEEKGYQANEYKVYNAGKTEANSELFEELNLPGVTNFAQAKHIAQWHMAQLKLRPEMYSLNVDFEYLVCNRGDLVRVTHDVPLWGSGSGRIKTCSTGSAAIQLTEEIYLESGKTYNIRVRTNAGASVLKTLTAINTTGYYSTITITNALTVGDNINPDDLFMLGEVSKESQELIVLSIETSGSVSAKLMLADYSPQIYTTDLSQFTAYNSNITTTANYLVNSIISETPTIVSVNSDSALSQQIANGSYTNTAIISYSNTSQLSKSVEQVELQVIPGDVMFDSISSIYYGSKDSSSITVQQLTSGIIYKARARYTNTSGTIVGPWSETFWFTNGGKLLNFSEPPTLAIDLEDKYIVVTPTVTTEVNDFNAYAYRLYKDSGITDLWDTAPVIAEVQSTGQGRLNLTDVPQPRISEAGITYRVACRVLDKTNNYSSTSSYATIVIKTIV